MVSVCRRARACRSGSSGERMLVGRGGWWARAGKACRGARDEGSRDRVSMSVGRRGNVVWCGAVRRGGLGFVGCALGAMCRVGLSVGDAKQPDCRHGGRERGRCVAQEGLVRFRQVGGPGWGVMSFGSARIDLSRGVNCPDSGRVGLSAGFGAPRLVGGYGTVGLVGWDSVAMSGNSAWHGTSAVLRGGRRVRLVRVRQVGGLGRQRALRVGMSDQIG